MPTLQETLAMMLGPTPLRPPGTQAVPMTGTADPVRELLDRLTSTQPPPVNITPEPLSKGRAIAGAIADALTAYNASINRGAPAGRFVQRALETNQRQATQKAALQQRQYEREIDNLKAALGVEMGQQRLAAEKQQAQEATQFRRDVQAFQEEEAAANRKFAEEQAKRDEAFRQQQLAIQKKIAGLREKDPKQAARAEEGAANLYSLVGEFIYGNEQAGIQGLANRDPNQSADEILNEFKIRALPFMAFAPEEAYTFARAQLGDAIQQWRAGNLQQMAGAARPAPVNPATVVNPAPNSASVVNWILRQPPEVQRFILNLMGGPVQRGATGGY